MSLDVWTSRIDIVGRDPDAIDITRAGAVKKPRGLGVPFAPSWALLQRGLDARRGGAPFPFEAYAEAYKAEMRASYRAERDAWTALLARPRVILCCFCMGAEQCHRTTLARDILPKLGAVYRGEIPTALAISVRQPWAWAILRAGKDIENRGRRYWGAVRVPREPVLLHASSGCTRQEYEGVCEALHLERLLPPGLDVPSLEDLPRGALVAEMRIRERVIESESRWFSGPVGLVVDRVIERPPVPCAGALGLFRVPYPVSWPSPARHSDPASKEGPCETA